MYQVQTMKVQIAFQGLVALQQKISELQNVICHFKINHLNIRGEIQRKYKFHQTCTHFMHNILLHKKGNTYCLLCSLPLTKSNKVSSTNHMALTVSQLQDTIFRFNVALYQRKKVIYFSQTLVCTKTSLSLKGKTLISVWLFTIHFL